MATWPRLAEQFRPLVRLDGSVQFGLDPGSGVRLCGLTEAEVGWLRNLDGGADPVRSGTRAGVDPARLQELLHLLGQANLLGEHGGDARGETARVWVEGRLRLADRIAALLREGDIGELARLTADDPIPAYRRGPALVVLVTDQPTGARDAQRWRARGIPHLPVALGPDTATVGPLVPARGGPCLGCVDLARADRDPSWSLIAAQARVGADQPAGRADVSLVAIAAGLAARVATSFLDGMPPTGLALDVAAPWPSVRQHRWRTHPLCAPCAEPAGAPVTIGA